MWKAILIQVILSNAGTAISADELRGPEFGPFRSKDQCEVAGANAAGAAASRYVGRYGFEREVPSNRIRFRYDCQMVLNDRELREWK
jgi:hypothetical protein